jgi:hypothetical protein
MLNVILLGGLFFHKSLIPSASGQTARLPAPSEYLITSGEITGGNAGVLFIIDTRNNWLTVRAYNNGSNTLEDMPPIDLARVFKQ